MTPSTEQRLRDLALDLDAGWRPISVAAPDGLHLAGRDYGDPDWPATPLLCLPGLTRNSKDFHSLAHALSSDTANPRRVIALDFRGRGRSQHDADWSHYAPNVEADDTRTVLAALGIERVAILGTSRGGLVGMLLALAAPPTIDCLVLNDIGPTIETSGLARIADNILHRAVPTTWEAAVEALKTSHERSFTAFGNADWWRLAAQLYRDVDGRPALDYDPAIGTPLATIDYDQPLPTAWEVFDAIGGTPVRVIRGANSDLLSAETVAEMIRRHPDCRSITIADQGHAPVLWEPEVIAKVTAFLP